VSEITFRRATSDDVPVVVDLVESAYRGESSRAGWTTEADLLEGQRIDAPMLHELLARDDTAVLLAEQDGQVVGCCELRRPAEPGAAAYLGMFAVRPGRQGGGLGRCVLEEGERVVRDEFGAGSLELTVIEVREELLAWYARRGYRATGRTEPFPYGDERFGVPLRDDLRFVVLAKPL